MADSTTTAPAVVIPAWKTAGFWGTVVLTLLGLLLASGLVSAALLPHVIGWITTVLTALGYKGLGTATVVPPGI